MKGATAATHVHGPGAPTASAWPAERDRGATDERQGAARTRAARAGRPVTAYGIYHTLARSPELPPGARRALQLLRDRAQANGGALGPADLSTIGDELSAMILRSSLRYKAVIDALAEGFPSPIVPERHPVNCFTANLAALGQVHSAMGLESPLKVPAPSAQRREEPRSGAALRAPSLVRAPPKILLRELDRGYLAAQVARLFTIHAWNSIEKPDGKGPRTTDCIMVALPELERFTRLCSMLRTLPQDHGDRPRLEKAQAEALRDALLVATCGATDETSMDRAASLAPAPLRLIYEWTRRTQSEDPLGMAPDIPKGLLEKLGSQGHYGLKVAAATDQRRELSRTPVLDATVEWLESEGVLEPKTFGKAVFAQRVHGLPGLAVLGEAMRPFGYDPSVALLKGYSTNPITAVALERGTRLVDTGYGQSERAPRAQDRQLATLVEQAFADAELSGKPVLFLGDGWESAQAVATAKARHPEVRCAYVENTQSGLNFLNAQPELPFEITRTLADVDIKKLFDAGVVGDWIVPRVMTSEKRKKEDITAVVLGFGFVGQGVASSLAARAGRIVVVDTDADRCAQAIAAGYEAIHCDPHRDSPPRGDYYFACTGFQKTFGERAFAASKPGALWVNCGSTGDLDLDFLHAAQTRKVPGLRTRLLDQEQVPEHRTIELCYASGARVRIAHRGLPYFDGIRDKNSKFSDVMMALRFATLTLAARDLSAGVRDDEVGRMPKALQERISDTIRSTYGTGTGS
jgi:S-adenosylhomocysteine hydrolase